MPLIEYDLDEPESQGRAEPERQGTPDGATNVILYAFLRHYRLVALACLIGGLIGFFQGATKVNVYRSEGMLWLQAGMREQTTVEQQLTQAGRSPQQRASALVQAEMQLLRSSELLGRVVDKLGTDFIFHVPDPTEFDNENTALPTKLLHEFQSWWIGKSGNPLLEDTTGGVGPKLIAVEMLRENLQLRAQGESGMISVAFEMLDPEQVQDLVNTFLQQASRYHTEFFAVTPQQRFMERELEKAGDERDSADEALRNFKAEHGIYDLNVQESNLQERIATLEQEVFADEVQLIRLKSQITSRERILNSDDPVAAGLVVRITNPEYAELRDRRIELSREIAGMSASTSADKTEVERLRKIRQKDAELLDRELEQLKRTILQDTPRKDALRSALDTDRALVLGLESALTPKRSQLAELRKELARIQKLETSYETMRARRSQAQAAFISTRDDLERISKFQRLDEKGFGNLSVLAMAELPGEKVGPNRGKSLMFGLILGGMFGFALAFGLVAADPLIRRPSDLLKVSSAKGLALLPVLRGKERREPGFPQDSKARRPDLQVLADRLWPRLRKPTGHDGCYRIGFLGEQVQVGNSEVAAAAAYGIAQRLQAKVLIIESSSSPTGIAHRFGVERTPGLHEVQRGESKIDKAIRPSGVDRPRRALRWRRRRVRARHLRDREGPRPPRPGLRRLRLRDLRCRVARAQCRDAAPALGLRAHRPHRAAGSLTEGQRSRKRSRTSRQPSSR